MQPALDPFHPLLRVIDRYRHDVHQLNPAPPEEMLAEASRALAQEVPPSLAAFLKRWNGATLFRGALRIRAIAELAPATEDCPQVVTFADGPGDGDRWAWAPHGQAGGAVFGKWADGVFEPLHERFDRWLAATILVLDHAVRDPESQLVLRLDCDPDCGFLLFRHAEQALGDGDPTKARDLLRRATAADPELVVAWERLGDTMLGEDKGQARWAYLKALRAIRLPAPYPTTYGVRPALLRTLASLFPPGDPGWERELVDFLGEAVRDVHTYAELDVAEAAAVELARVRIDRHDRTGARTALVDLLDRVRAFRRPGPCAEAVLLVAHVETELGHHDDAERRLRALRHLPPPLPSRMALALGRIAVMRQEPWAEDVLADALGGLVDPVQRCEALLLLGERHLLRERHDEAGNAFNEASRLAGQIGGPAFGARAAMGLGDLLRDKGDGPAAELCYREAREQAGQDREMLLRVLLRRGDLFKLVGEVDRAAADYARSAEGYRELELPIREAWARLRLGRMAADPRIGETIDGTATAVDRAHELFLAADVAAGVAAADAIRGDPARSIEWHINRAADHARDRANAQRARPPLVRADADRPERRMGAHRAAIAACGVPVVERLDAELCELHRALDGTNPRPTDSKLARYSAAADLLAAHRSWEASVALLRHLTEARPQGAVGKALIGAMARSPNTALVAGLLDALDRGGEPSGVAAAADVLGWRREREGLARLRALLGPDANRTVRRAAIVALGRIGDTDAIPDLLPILELPELAEEVSVALLLLGEWQGVDAQAQSLAAQRPGLTRSPGEIVGRYGGTSYLLLLLRTAEMEGPAGLGALQGLGYLGDPRAVPRLIEKTTCRDPARSLVASGAIEILTGHHVDADEALLRNRWTEWWATHREDFRDGLRYRAGRPVDPGLLVERLGDDDPMVRRGTYDELVISTGEHLPFDAEGPYRIQVTHQAAWSAWWRDHSDMFAAGRWWFHGEQIG